MANNIVLQTGGGGSDLEVQKDDSSVATSVSTLNFEDTGTATLTVTDEGAGKVTVSVAASGTTQNLFETIAVTGQSNVVADSPTDTLTFVGSNGIAITTNAGTDTVTFARVNNLLSRHNGAVTQTFGTTPITVQFGTNIRTDSNYTYNANGEVTINASGWYRITYDVSIDVPSGSTRTTSTTFLENNTVEISGTRAYGYHRTSANGLDTISNSLFLNLTATNVIRVRTNQINGGNLSTVANGCRLTFEFIGA